MSIVTLDLDKDVIALLEEQQYQPISEAAHELYRRGALSSGKGAQLLGIPRYDFIQRASQLDIPYFRLTEEDLQNEVC